METIQVQLFYRFLFCNNIILYFTNLLYESDTKN